MADKLKDRAKSVSTSGGVKTSGQVDMMKGPVFRDVDHTPRYRSGSSNPKPGKSSVVG